MAYLYSLTDSSLYLEIPISDSLQLKRRVVSVETLEGTQSRDLGADASDLTFTVMARLDSDTVNSLAKAMAAGNLLGFSLAVSSYEVLLRGVAAENLADGSQSVKIEMTVTRSLDIEPVGNQ